MTLTITLTDEGQAPGSTRIVVAADGKTTYDQPLHQGSSIFARMDQVKRLAIDLWRAKHRGPDE